MGVQEAKEQFLALIDAHFGENPKELAEFIHFTEQTLHKRFEQVMVEAEPDSLQKQVKLEEIIEEIKTRLNNFGESPDEEKNGYPHYPMVPDEEEEEGEQYTRQNSFHLDSFLFSDEEIDAMAQQGMIPRTYCVDCGSRNTKFLNYFSNSLSTDELETIFGYRALGNIFSSLKGKTIVDIGSRIGAVLYYAHIFTEASEIYGVEINKYFSDLCQKVVNGRRMQDRIKVINDDIFNQIDLVKKADIVVMHNVFEWFSEHETQQAKWDRVRNEMLVKPGQMIATTPSLQESLVNAGIDLEEFKFDEWVKEIPLQKRIDDQSEEDCCAKGSCGSACEEDSACCEDENCEHDHDHHHHGGHQHDSIHLYQVL